MRRRTAEVAFCFFALTADLIYRRFHVWAKLLLIARKYSTRREFPSAWRAVSSIASRAPCINGAPEIRVLIHAVSKSRAVLQFRRERALSRRGEKQRFDKYSRWIVHVRSRTPRVLRRSPLTLRSTNFVSRSAFIFPTWIVNLTLVVVTQIYFTMSQKYREVSYVIITKLVCSVTTPTECRVRNGWKLFIYQKSSSQRRKG